MWSEVKAAQSCLTLWDPMDYIVHEILQASILEWLAFPFSRGSSQHRDQSQVSRTAGGFFTSWVTREALQVVCFGTKASKWDQVQKAFIHGAEGDQCDGQCWNTVRRAFTYRLKGTDQTVVHPLRMMETRFFTARGISYKYRKRES